MGRRSGDGGGGGAALWGLLFTGGEAAGGENPKEDEEKKSFIKKERAARSPETVSDRYSIERDERPWLARGTGKTSPDRTSLFHGFGEKKRAKNDGLAKFWGAKNLLAAESGAGS